MSTSGLVTIAKNQGNCGSCAAFAAHGLHETCMAKAGAPTAKLDLSEQYMIDCGFNKRYANKHLLTLELPLKVYH